MITTPSLYTTLLFKWKKPISIQSILKKRLHKYFITLTRKIDNIDIDINIKHLNLDNIIMEFFHFLKITTKAAIV
jgi:hypothetical protein